MRSLLLTRIPRLSVAAAPRAVLCLVGVALIQIAVIAGVGGAGSDDSLKGVPPSDAAEWRHYGISAEESQRWVRAGIIFAAWAAQWRGEGFSPEAAGTWREIANVYTAGDFLKNGFGPEEAKEWMSQGIQSGLRAREYLSAGLGAQEAGTFWKERLYPDDVKEWRNAGFDAAAMLQWRFGPRESPFYYTKDSPSGRTLYALDQMRTWRDAGCTAEEAHASGLYGIGLEEALKWKAAGFSFFEAAAWRDSGFTLNEASVQRSAGLGHAEADRRRYDGSATRADEITSLDLDITVNRDGTLDVIEMVELVDRPGGMYEQGFYRDLPGQEQLRSLRSYGFSRVAYSRPLFKVRLVEWDGMPASYTIRGNRLILNDPAAADGSRHRCTLVYSTDDHIVHEQQHDVLSFTVLDPNPPGRYVRSASALIRLPQGADVIFADGWAGLERRRDLAWSVQATESGDIVRVEATRPLAEKMSFGVNIGFVQGIVDEGPLHRIAQLDRRSGRLLSSFAVFVAGFLLAGAYFVIAWYGVGRDPRGRGVPDIVTSAPSGTGPASLRQISFGGKRDHLSVAAELVGLAGQGMITISEQEGAYQLERTAADLSGLPRLSRDFISALFTSGERIALPARGRSKGLSTAARTLMTGLKLEQRGYGVSHLRYLRPGIILALAALGISLSVIDYSEMEESRAMTALAVMALFQVISFVLLSLLFLRLLRAPTRSFVELRGQVDGYRSYLARMLSGSAGFLPQARQKHLAYAIAAGIDLGRCLVRGSDAEWYRGSSGGFSCRDFIAAVKRSV